MALEDNERLGGAGETGRRFEGLVRRLAVTAVTRHSSDEIILEGVYSPPVPGLASPVSYDTLRAEVCGVVGMDGYTEYVALELQDAMHTLQRIDYTYGDFVITGVGNNEFDYTPEEAEERAHRLLTWAERQEQEGVLTPHEETRVTQERQQNPVGLVRSLVESRLDTVGEDLAYFRLYDTQARLIGLQRHLNGDQTVTVYYPWRPKVEDERMPVIPVYTRLTIVTQLVGDEDRHWLAFQDKKVPPDAAEHAEQDVQTTSYPDRDDSTRRHLIKISQFLELLEPEYDRIQEAILEDVHAPQLPPLPSADK